MPSSGMLELGRRIEDARKYLKLSRAKLLSLVVPSMSMTSYLNLISGSFIYDVDSMNSLLRILNIPREYAANILVDEYISRVQDKLEVKLPDKVSYNALVDLEIMFKRASKDRQALFLEYGRAILTQITSQARQ